MTLLKTWYKRWEKERKERDEHFEMLEVEYKKRKARTNRFAVCALLLWACVGCGMFVLLALAYYKLFAVALLLFLLFPSFVVGAIGCSINRKPRCLYQLCKRIDDCIIDFLIGDCASPSKPTCRALLKQRGLNTTNKTNKKTKYINMNPGIG